MDNRRDEPNLKLINMEQVEVEKIDWLLYPFIPFGKVTIVQGDPGEGKTTMVLQIIAKLTKGEAVLPSGSDEPALEEKTMDLEPVNVIYQTAEDGLGDTIKPRLLSAGADCSRVMVIDDNDQALTMMDARLEEAIIKTKARLVVLDPIQGFLGAAVDMHRANEIRPLMKRVAVLAEKYHCAIILIGHMNKNSNGKSSYRGLGSIDFQAAARSVLIVGRIKDEPEIRVVCHVKSSLAPEGKSIAFRLDKDTGFEWIGEYDISADDLLSGDNRGQKIHEAKEFLKEILVSGSVAQTKVAEEAESRGIKKKTLWNAKKELEIESVKIGKKDYDDLEKDADKVADMCNQLCDDVDKLEVISDKYKRALRIFGSDTIESAIWHDIQKEKALEEQKRKEQMPRKLSDRLQWGRERSQEHNMQQKKNKIKHKEMEL